MGIDWCCQAQAILQMDLPCGRVKQIGSSDDLSNTLKSIVNDHCQLVGGQTVSSSDNKVTDYIRQVFFDMALYEIGETYRHIINPETDRAGRFTFWQAIAAGAGVNARGRQFRPAASAPVGEPLIQEISYCEFVGFRPVALVQQRLIRLQSKPLQVLENPVCTPPDLPGWIDVFNPDQPLATRRLCLQVAGNSRNQ
jgi:hypothetical protein